MKAVSERLPLARSRKDPVMSPDEWALTLSAPPEIESDNQLWKAAKIRQWSGTSHEMDQPPLDHHLIVQHLGGPKQVQRSKDGRAITKVVESGSLSLVPAGSSFKWLTHGPIGFAHLYVPPTLFASTTCRLAGCNHISLLDKVGCRDALLEALFASMRAEAKPGAGGCTLYLDSMLETFVIGLLVNHGTARVDRPKGLELLPQFQLSRVLEFIDANLATPLTLSDLARVANSSVFHFSRAFRNSAGEPPYTFVMRRRIVRAASLLEKSDLSIEAIAIRCGFKGNTQFARAFTKWMGQTPSQYRRG